jgi:pterin-4a-carbinolamine dehydratase
MQRPCCSSTPWQAWLNAKTITPTLKSAYGRVKVSYSTHDVGGLSRNDFVCAAKIEALTQI